LFCRSRDDSALHSPPRSGHKGRSGSRQEPGRPCPPSDSAIAATTSGSARLSNTDADHGRRNTTPATSNAARQQWRNLVAQFARPSAPAAIIQLLNTGLPLLACLVGLIVGFDHGIWLALLLVLPAALLVVRLFIIQHDCGHGSFFKSRRANDALGWIAGMVTRMPYAASREDDAIHHAHSGNV